MRSYLDHEGVYDKTKRYMVNNWSDEDFTQHFGSETIYNDTKVIETQPAYDLTVQAGEIRELGQFEAFIFTKHFVDREMYKAAKQFSDRQLKERAEMAINNPDARKPFEEKTIKEIGAGSKTPFMDKLREEIRAEEIARLQEEGPKEEGPKDVDIIPEFDTSNTTLDTPIKEPKESKLDKRTREYKEAIKAKAKMINEKLEAKEFSE